jgi:hypothetical protein
MLALSDYTTVELVGAAVVVLLLPIACAIGMLVQFVRERHSRWYRRDLEVEVASAEMAIRQIRRQAAMRLIAGEREYGREHTPSEIIEGTAVEARRDG